MRTLKLIAIMSLALLFVPRTQAAEVGIAVGVGPAHFGVAIGAPPVCRWGYYSYYPYACAPYGYYGPEWFDGGVFIGAGPWTHGFHERPGFYAGRGFYHAPAPVIRDRGNFGRVPPVETHPAFRNDFRGNPGTHFNGGSPRTFTRGTGNGFHGSGSHGGGHR